MITDKIKGLAFYNNPADCTLKSFAAANELGDGDESPRLFI